MIAIQRLPQARILGVAPASSALNKCRIAANMLLISEEYI